MQIKVRIGQRLTCLRCGKTWHARQMLITICPACKTKHFNVPKPRKRVVA